MTIIVTDEDRPVLEHGPRSLACMQAIYSLLYNCKMKVSRINKKNTHQRLIVWVEVYKLGPERLWIIPELVEVGGNPDGRSPTVLTCKSLVRVRYRGERPIEQSGSWFYPKYLSG